MAPAHPTTTTTLAAVAETAPDNLSYWCECRACHAHYAVAEPAILTAKPKVGGEGQAPLCAKALRGTPPPPHKHTHPSLQCHFCRLSGRSSTKPKKASQPDTPTLACTLCRNEYICADPGALGLPRGGRALALARAEWICPPCAVGGVESSLCTLTATVDRLVRVCSDNRALVLAAVGLDAPAGFDLFSGDGGGKTTLFKAREVLQPAPGGARVPATDAAGGLVFEGASPRESAAVALALETRPLCAQASLS